MGDAGRGKSAGERGLALTEVAAQLLGDGADLRFVARGGSMSPFIRDGDLVTVEAVPSIAGGLNVGDVVIFREPSNGRMVVHRLRARVEGGWLAHGDRNFHSDGVVEDAVVLGRVKDVERGGRKVVLTGGRGSVLLARVSRVLLEVRLAWIRRKGRST